MKNIFLLDRAVEYDMIQKVSHLFRLYGHNIEASEAANNDQASGKR